MKRGVLLGFELIGEDHIRVPEEVLVYWDDILIDVKPSIVTHYGIQHYHNQSSVLRTLQFSLPMRVILTPEEGPRLRQRLPPQVSGYRSNCSKNLSVERVSREEHIKSYEIVLLQPFVNFVDFLGGCLSAFVLAIGGVIT